MAQHEGLFLCWYRCPGLWWVRVPRSGWGLHVKDVRRHPYMLWSERHGHARRVGIGPWRVKVLPPRGADRWGGRNE